MRECLVESEQEKSNPDLRLVDFKNVGQFGIDVCLFRVCASIGSVEGVADWLKYHNMEPHLSHRTRFGSDTVLVEIFASRSRAKNGGLLVPEPRIYGYLHPVHSEIFGCEFVKDSEIDNAGYGAAVL